MQETNSTNDLIGVKKFRQLALKQIQTFESGKLIYSGTCFTIKMCVYFIWELIVD